MLFLFGPLILEAGGGILSSEVENLSHGKVH